MEDERIIELFFERSELAIKELDNKYGNGNLISGSVIQITTTAIGQKTAKMNWRYVLTEQHF